MANEILASPVSAFLLGRQNAQQNQLAQTQIQQAQQTQQRDAQFRQALPAYLTGGTNALAALYAADPERAMQAQTFANQQNQIQQAQVIEKAKRAHAQATGVMNSASPAKYMQVLLPDIAKQWAAHNGKSVEELTDEDAKSLAGEVAIQAGAAAGIEPKPSEPFTLSEGQVRFDAKGKPLATVAKAPPAPTAEDVDRPFKRANVLRDEFNAANKDFGAVQSQYQNIVATSANPSAAGDISLIFSFMKMLDPASTVREGEFATAQNSGSAFSKVGAMYNKVLNGERLTANQRADFVGQASSLFSTRQKQSTKVRERYTKLAKRASVDPLDVVGEEQAGNKAPPAGVRKSVGGKNYVQVDGQWYEDDGQ